MGDLAVLSDELLSAAAGILVAGSLPAPARQFSTVGPPADECSQLVVWWGKLNRGAPANEEFGNGPRCGGPRSAELHLRYTDCWPTSDSAPIPAAVYDAASATISDAAWLMYQELARQMVQGDLFVNRGSSLGPCEAIEPEGGLAGFEIGITVMLGG